MKMNRCSTSFKTGLALFLLGLVAAGVWGLFYIKPQETISGMIPQTLKEQILLFESSPFNRKLFAVVSAPDDAASLQYAQNLQEELLEKQLILPGFTPSAQLAQTMVQALPFRFTSKDAQLIEEKNQPASVEQLMSENYEKLISFESFFFKSLLPFDPLHFIDLMSTKLAALNPHPSTHYEDGFLTAKNGTIRVGIYDLAVPADFASARTMQRVFDDFSATLPQGASAFFLGGLRYTAENVALIKHDLWRIALLSLICLMIIFVVFLRAKQAVFIYVLPLAVIPFSALVTYGVFGRLSGITLGFGSVVAGLCIDYAVYVFFALRSKSEISQTRKHLFKHLSCTFITSSFCFVALLISSIEVFRQIAVFSLTGLFLSWVAALYIFPIYWTNLPSADTVPGNQLKVLPKRIAVLVTLVVLMLGVLGVKYTHFSGDMQTLNATSSLFQRQRAVLQKALGNEAEQQGLLFFVGNTRQEVLELSEKAAQKYGLSLPTTDLIPSEKAAKEQLEAWKRFWTPARQEAVKYQVQMAATKQGISAQAFDPFFKFISNPPSSDPFDLTQIYNPVLELPDGKWAVVNMVPASPSLAQIVREFGGIYISGPALQQDLLNALKTEALQIILVAVILNFGAVSLLFKSIKKALLAFIPVSLAAAFTFVCFWLFRIEVNLFVLVFLPLLIGLGIDYAIFQLIRAEADPVVRAAQAPAALWTAALSTLAGFGVLIFARHQVLFMMGFASFLGVGGAMLAAQFILPSFLEEK